MNRYEDARKQFLSLHRWLRGINESAAESLKEAFEELLTLHRLGAPAELRRALRSTNAIESLFSRVRYYEKQIRRYRSSSMSQRWLGTVLLHSENGFHKIRGSKQIGQLMASMKQMKSGIDIVAKAA